MIEPKLILTEDIPDNLLVDLDRREAALWLRSLPKDPAAQEVLTEFLGLPWRMVFSEVSDPRLVKALEEGTNATDPMTRKRGFIQIIDGDPSRIELPQRCLPIYLLNGRQGASHDDFQSRLRRMTMLEELRRSGVRQIVIVSGDDDPGPPELMDLWSSGFRSFLTFATDATDPGEVLEAWLKGLDGLAAASLLSLPTGQVVANILRRYAASYPESLSGWLEEEAVPYFRKREVELTNREMIREHALGEALTANAFVGLARYEVHLDRKLERTLTMLIRLQDLRRGSPET